MAHIQIETDNEAMAALQRFGSRAIELAREDGFMDDPSMTKEERSQALLKRGLPLAMADPDYASLLL